MNWSIKNKMEILKDFNPRPTVKNVSQLRDVMLSLKFTWSKDGLEMFLDELQRATSNPYDLDLFVQRFYHTDILYENIGKQAVRDAEQSSKDAKDDMEELLKPW